MLNKKARVQFIFVTILLDALGIGLLIPILPDLIRRFSEDPSMVSQYFGYFISVYALMQFLASPVLGSLSDRFGRRPVLLVSLLGAGLDYLIMAFAPNMLILFIGRIISGLTGASMTVATAYMADISDNSNRSSNFGMIGAAFGLGFIFGPALGGLIGSLGWQAPFFVAAALNILNFIFGYFILPESLPTGQRRKIEIGKMNPFSSIMKILKPSPIMLLIWVYILLFLAGQVHPSTWTLYTEHKFGWTALQVGVSLSFVGLSFAIVQGGLMRIIIPRLGEWNSLVAANWISILSFLAWALATKGWMMYAILAPSALAAVGGPALQSLISHGVPPSEQGELQGTLVSLASLTAIAGPLLFTGLFAHYTAVDAPAQFAGAPYLGASVISALAGVLLYFAHRREKLRLRSAG
jgi:DHA1 family tetracycline resistance protein-like MFS transporter